MSHKLSLFLFLSVLAAKLPFVGAEQLRRFQATNTERVSLSPGGVIRFNNSYGDLTVEGWDQPAVEITVIKSMPFGYNLKQPEEAQKHLDSVQVVTEHKSSTELVIGTMLPSRGNPFAGGQNFRPLSRESREVSIEYEIHAPRDSKLVIHHGTGSVFVSDVTGDIEARCGRGDIVLMLRDTGAYSIDAKSKFGTVISDFEGAARVRRYRLGESYATANAPSSNRIYLRMGFGGITIKAVPAEASIETADSPHRTFLWSVADRPGR